MLQKWKDIIANWINCYFNESEKREERVTLESLLNIISHLRENLSLDESKSSILEAHTVEEFVREKYPDFRFNNGSAEASSEDEIYVVASLLLYFVCVNSKDVDIKHAMCSQLSSEDQEIILKFSKCLMECAPFTYKDVQAAITEACSQHSSAIGPSSSRQVSETPPALRSLHGEVRRLQAALDAERFDRNYLQEELARTNLRVEKLAKDKEQYKLEMVNLKAKISMCCGQEKDAQAGDAAAESTAKLMRQLEDLEERLVQTQGQLDDAQYERDTYKAKINELKQERDKWVAESQQEAARASQLCSELEAERRQVQSLTEIVAELRQHNQLNRMDSSLLECDDPDASVHSLHHNISVCSEACANVVEVQLGEERAKIVVLKQQIQSLQDQLNDLTLKSETEKQSLEKVISEREYDIFELKHRINEEIEEKNNMTIHFSDAMSKLNNEINELEQKLKDNNQQSRMVVEAKMQEIQTLQEEKLSLLQSLTDETNKLENVIKTLKAELDAEKTSKAKMRDDYENHMMKLNEKVLNRNNELVELQNDVFEKSDKIEALYSELRKEKQARDDLVVKHHNECEQMNERLLEKENTVKLKCDEIERLTERLHYNFDFIKELGREVDELKYAVTEQSETCRVLEGTKITMLEELQMKDKKLEELQKHLENMQNVHSEEKDRLEKDLDETTATVNSLQMQLHGELRFKIGLQEDYAQLEQTRASLSEEVEKLREEVHKLQNEIHHKDKTIEGMDLFLQEEKQINKKIKQECQNLNEKIKNLSEDVFVKNNEIKAIETELAQARKTFEEELLVKNDTIESVNQKLEELSEDVFVKNNEIKAIETELAEARKTFEEELRVKNDYIESVNQELKKLSEDVLVKNNEIKAIETELADTRKTFEEELRFKNDTIESVNQKLSNVIEEKDALEIKLNQTLKERDTIYYELSEKLNEILKLQEENSNLNETIQSYEKCKYDKFA
ncbi:hypothetical protein ABMA28_006137 [Loxostege sticticalis]|uniref:Uncharacterized protein n=1 Tax=Loxostege sticticalis TaxID=481309 RepID=A0ABD0SK51_LOXSC